MIKLIDLQQNIIPKIPGSLDRYAFHRNKSQKVLMVAKEETIQLRYIILFI